jgi:hypothetical protein
MKSRISISGVYGIILTPGSKLIAITEISGSRLIIYDFNSPVIVDLPEPAVPMK